MAHPDVWEYYVLTWPRAGGQQSNSLADLQADLHELGGANPIPTNLRVHPPGDPGGWELAGILPGPQTSLLIFKRPPAKARPKTRVVNLGDQLG